MIKLIILKKSFNAIAKDNCKTTHENSSRKGTF